MTTSTSPLNRQPTKLDYTSPTQFRFVINQLPKVEYFTVAANVPGITLGSATYATPLKDIPYPGEKLTYEDLTLTFIVDENLENYIERMAIDNNLYLNSVNDFRCCSCNRTN
tara:strand:+ start:472 stop:807 length:336 start_codon:yes stop_codon:yes gene_type:complete